MPLAGLQMKSLSQIVMNNSRRVGLLLVLVGVVLLVVSIGSLFRARDRDRTRHALKASLPGGAEASVSPVATSAMSWPTMRLGPTAAAAATRLPPPTLVPTPGPAPARPLAPLRIVIPAIGVDASVVEVSWRVVHVGDEVRGVWDTVAEAAGHHRGSADPGQPSNCVLSAHSSDAGGAVFRRLGELVSGDLVQLYTVGGQHYEYVVDTVLTVDELGATSAEKREHAKWLDPTDEPLLTLVTCWPAWSYTHRILVRASLHVP